MNDIDEFMAFPMEVIIYFSSSSIFSHYFGSSWIIRAIPLVVILLLFSWSFGFWPNIIRTCLVVSSSVWWYPLFGRGVSMELTSLWDTLLAMSNIQGPSIRHHQQIVQQEEKPATLLLVTWSKTLKWPLILLSLMIPMIKKKTEVIFSEGALVSSPDFGPILSKMIHFGPLWSWSSRE